MTITRRAFATGAGALLVPTRVAAESSEGGYSTFHVFDGIPPGCLGWWPDAVEIRASGAVVVGYEPIGMPETYDTLDFVSVDPPVPMADWLQAARFPRDAWGEPTFVRVYWESRP